MKRKLIIATALLAAVLVGCTPNAPETKTAPTTAPTLTDEIITEIAVNGETPEKRGEALKNAVDKALSVISSPNAPEELTLILADGEYLLSEPITIKNESSTKLIFKAATGAHPTVTGALTIPDSAWTKVEGKDYYSAKLDSAVKVRDLFADGKRIPIASGETLRTPADFGEDPENGIYLHREAAEKLESIAFPTEISFYVQWEFYRLHAIGVDYNDTQTVDGVELVRVKFPEDEIKTFATGINHTLTLNNHPYFFENNLSLIAPGSCVSDYSEGIVYYYPESGEPHSVKAAVLDNLIVMRGTKNVSFNGIGFSGTTCKVGPEHGYLTSQANTEQRFGVVQCAAILLDGCENIAVNGCTFKNLGTNGILSVNTSSDITVDTCDFDDISMSAIAIGNHNTEWSDTEFNRNIVINNNMITNIGFEYPCSTSVYVSHVENLKLTHNTIDNVAYSGISVGWGWSMVPYGYGESVNIKDAEIAYNKITNFMTKLKDGGAIYVVGANCKVEYTELFNKMHDNFASNSGGDSLFVSGYYLDGSSSNWHLYDNVIVGKVVPLALQYVARGQDVHNVLCERTYTTKQVDEGAASEERNVVINDTFVKGNTMALYKSYPEAKAIYNAAGAVRETATEE